MKHKRIIRRILTILLATVFLCSAVMALRIWSTARQEQQAFSQLAAQVDAATDATAMPLMKETQIETVAPEISPYQRLKEENPDFYGWLSIDNTTIDYPVMYTPNDPEYYLRRAFDGTDSHSGVPFIDGSCFPGCGNILIYGHNLDTGGMFSDLLNYADFDFYRKHPQIQFDTPEAEGTYEVFAAVFTQVTGAAVEFPYYQYTNLQEEADFSAYVERLIQLSCYNSGITPLYGEELLTLSTCSYHAVNGRFVVVARRVA